MEQTKLFTEPSNKDVHTEHCCKYHGCKYGDEDCTVTTNLKPQSWPCEYCEEVPYHPFTLKREPYFKMTGCVNDGGKCVEIKDKLALEVASIFRCGVNEENQFFMECPECKVVFTSDDANDFQGIMVAHGNDNHWYGRKGEKYCPTYEM